MEMRLLRETVIAKLAKKSGISIEEAVITAYARGVSDGVSMIVDGLFGSDEAFKEQRMPKE